MALEGIPGVVPAVSYFPGIHREVSIALLPTIGSTSGRLLTKNHELYAYGTSNVVAANSLLAQKQKRKLMIVLTDGDQMIGLPRMTLLTGADAVALSCWDRIQTRSVEKFFPQSCD